MGISLPTASRQLTLSLEPGLAQRHINLRACMAAGVYARGLDIVACKIDSSPSKLCEKLAGGSGDRPRDVGLMEFETYLEKTRDFTPILYLVDKFLRDPAAVQLEALAGLAALAEQLPALLAAAGIDKASARGRK